MSSNNNNDDDDDDDDDDNNNNSNNNNNRRVMIRTLSTASFTDKRDLFLKPTAQDQSFSSFLTGNLPPLHQFQRGVKILGKDLHQLAPKVDHNRSKISADSKGH